MTDHPRPPRPPSVDRRTVLKAFAAAGVAAAMPGALRATSPQDSKPAAAKKKILVLGGTNQLGPKFVEAALARGHEITLFNRGKTNPHLFPELEKLRGDRRKGELDALKGDRRWDVVVDTSAYVPRVVRQVSEILKGRVDAYVMISSISVYPRADGEDTDESTPVGVLEDPNTEKVMENYGPLKAACEAEAEKWFPGKTVNLRPGLIVGDGDESNRFGYWPLRVAAGGEVLAPIGPEQTIQWIDVKDLAAFMVKALEEGIYGVYNAVGPAVPFGTLLPACRKAAKSDAEFTYVSLDFLQAEKVRPWQDIPCWVPPAEGKSKCPVSSGAKAAAKGMTFRPVEDTVADQLAFERARPADDRFKGGLSRERETELLAKWKQRSAPK
ncbi:MAG TPA: NAD-dependent epimerase/dehydratase family protein [Planctomycetota bacterium]|nr:NAD-dependent epimerase/dehydratase family protein [Planctomycetota bacterium]